MREYLKTQPHTKHKKSLFVTIKRKPKINYYSEGFSVMQKNMEYYERKAKMNKLLLPQKIRVKETDMSNQEKIATEFNRFFANFGPILAKQIAENKNTC